MTIRLLTLLLCLLWSPTAWAQSSIWPNEPAGAAVKLDCNFSSTPSACGILDAYSSSIQATDASAPISASGVVKSNMPARSAFGGMQLNYVTPQIYPEMYVGLMWRTNPQFQGRRVGNKLFFIRGPQNNGVFLFNNAALNNGSGVMIFAHNSGALNNSHACALDLGLACYPNVGPGILTVGTWTKLEAYIKSSTTATSRDGIVRWWINGAPAGNYTNLNINQLGSNEWVWSETWDGCGINGAPPCDIGPTGVNTSEWSHFIDHLHISIPNCSGNCGGVPPPPPPPMLPPNMPTNLRVQ